MPRGDQLVVLCLYLRTCGLRVSIKILRYTGSVHTKTWSHKNLVSTVHGSRCTLRTGTGGTTGRVGLTICDVTIESREEL